MPGMLMGVSLLVLKGRRRMAGCVLQGHCHNNDARKGQSKGVCFHLLVGAHLMRKRCCAEYS